MALNFKYMRMKKLFTAVSVFLITSSSALAFTQIVDVEDYEFSPAIFTVSLGDTIIWMWAEGLHTTTSTTIPPGASPWSQVIDQNSQALIYIPSVPGSYDYQCDYHASMNMLGHFTVTDPLGIAVPKERLVRLRSSRVSEYLTVEMPELRDFLLPIVRDLTGRVIKNFEPITAETTSLYVGDLKNGIYLLELASGQRVISYRFIKY